MLRLLLLVLYLIVFGILLIPIFILWLIIKDKGNHLVHRVVQTLMKGAARSYMWITGVKFEIKGLENIPAETALYVSNHTGIYDIAAAYASFKGPLSFIGTKEAKGIPVIGQIMMMMNGLFLNRDNLKQGLEVVLKAIDHLKNGLNVWVCPEGTREKEGGPAELLPFHAGSFKIAAKAGCPVVPVIILGSRALFEDHKPWLSGGTLKIRYGKPVYLSDLDEEDRRRVGDYFRNLMIEMIENEPE